MTGAKSVLLTDGNSVPGMGPGAQKAFDEVVLMNNGLERESWTSRSTVSLLECNV